MCNDKKKIIQVNNLEKHFIKKNILNKEIKRLKAVDGIGFEVAEGESLGLVGESGCGKSTTAMLLSGLIPSTGGHIYFNGEDITDIYSKDMAKKNRRKKIQMVFQDPSASLNPRMKIKSILAEPFTLQGKKADDEQLIELLANVGLEPEYMDRYPHEMSGGQKQRIIIARALSMEPQVLILDEPTASLDVNVQAQIINLLEKLRYKYKLCYIYISHDLSIIKCVCQKVAVMYLGKIVEQGPTDVIFNKCRHPYTQALFSNIPVLDDDKPQKIILEGDVPSPSNIPSGCRFNPRCPKVQPKCREIDPNIVNFEDGSQVACHLYRKGDS